MNSNPTSKAHTEAMTSRDQQPPVHHVFDDIEEQDNHLPNWWLAILFASIVFAFGYWFVFETTASAPSPLTAYLREMAAIAKQRASVGPVTDESLAIMAKDGSTVNDGKHTFGQMCAPCHGPNGQGNAGPNLTDKFWLHGAKPTDVHKSITNGFPDKGMPAWGPMLGDARVRALSAYVVSLRNTNVPGGKAPQGDPVE
ncbi:MAG: c-type cytochrome [Deltaproteobacteria bacterium]|nr:c-type cytochrome [Deltaproteobacteria bacterium]